MRHDLLLRQLSFNGAITDAVSQHTIWARKQLCLSETFVRSREIPENFMLEIWYPESGLQEVYRGLPRRGRHFLNRVVIRTSST
jgi:hypothetical protein